RARSGSSRPPRAGLLWAGAMATNTPPTAWSPTTGAARYRPQQLWQVPVFLAGVLALAGVALTRGGWCGRPEPAECDLAAARRLAAEPNCPVDRLEHLLERPLADAGTPVHAGEAHFLL